MFSHIIIFGSSLPELLGGHSLCAKTYKRLLNAGRPESKSLRSRTHCDCCEVRAAAAKWSNPAGREYRNADRWLSRRRIFTRTDNDGEYTLGERLRPRRFRWCPGRGVLSHCVACDRGILFFACCRNPAGSACSYRGYRSR